MTPRAEPCPTCGFTSPAGHVHTCSPQVCPTCGGSGWLYGVRCGTCTPTRPEGLDFDAATVCHAKGPPGVYTLDRDALNAQHRQALDALRAQYRQAVEEAYREGWNEFGRSGPTDQSKGDTVEKAWSQSDALAALPEVSE